MLHILICYTPLSHRSVILQHERRKGSMRLTVSVLVKAGGWAAGGADVGGGQPGPAGGGGFGGGAGGRSDHYSGAARESKS